MFENFKKGFGFMAGAVIAKAVIDALASIGLEHLKNKTEEEKKNEKKDSE